MNLLPKLRAGLEAFPVKVKDEDLIAIRDREGYLSQIVLLPPAVFLVATLLNGKTTVPEIQSTCVQALKGLILKPEEIGEIVRRLDESYLLETERFHARRRTVTDEFSRLITRPAAHAGMIYEKDPEKLKAQLTGYFADPRGAGIPPEPRTGSVPRGLVSPHIDFARGAWCYTWAYKMLMMSGGADLYVVLGVSHSPAPTPFVLTSKSFETPLGLVPVARDWIDRLRQTSPDSFDYEIAHRMEHSIELQLVFLQYLHGSTRPFEIVPVLCASFEECCPSGSSPASHAVVEKTIHALRELLSREKRRVCVVIGADLSHRGPAFGDEEPADADLYRRTEQDDLESLHRIEEGNAERFYASVMKDGNQRNVCGLSAIYTGLRLMESPSGAPRGQLLRYSQADDGAGGFVSFAGMVFP
ncbi:MAG TPA: AmmeMemoRadiSam system protein B [Elusimicrobiota bacterium]|nr:AmmeMemoRadiSam system protein B [Elusimicrobiota bacterium]